MSSTVTALLLAVALVVPSSRAAERLTPEETEALLSAACERLSASPEGQEPFRIRAKLRFTFDPAAPEGEFVHTWLGPSRERSEWSFPGWQQVEVRDQGAIWSWSDPENDSGMQAVANRLHALLAPGSLLTGVAREAGARVQMDGRELVRIELGDADSPRRTVWVEEQGAELVAAEGERVRHDFAGSRSAGGRTWPFSVRILLEGEPFLRARFGKPSFAEASPGEVLSPPEGSVPGPSSMTAGFESPMLVHDPAPDYPERDLRNGKDGTVVIRAIIGTDGNVSEAVLLQSSASRAMDSAALRSVRGREYEPGLINGEPVEVVTTIRVTFEVTTTKRRVHQIRGRSAGAR